MTHTAFNERGMRRSANGIGMKEAFSYVELYKARTLKCFSFESWKS